MSGHVLVLDDEQEMCTLLAEGLGRRGFEVEWCINLSDAVGLLAGRDFDAALVDLNLGGHSGLELCQQLAAQRPEVPVVVITAFGSLEAAVAAIRAGAYDFITKPFRIDEVALALGRAVERRVLGREVRRLQQELSQAQAPVGVVGESTALRRVLELVERVADSDVTVLITGESGTGKEEIARALHSGSRRRDAPFVAVSCAALPEQLLESELFGHTRGAFTDARRERSGLFCEAQGGTLLLDEIGDMPPSLQPKLLRALQERAVRPVGSDSTVPVDVRVVAATNRDLEEARERGTFRADLYYRIAVVTIELPPLRVRGNDVLLLARHFLSRAAARAGKEVTGIASEVARALLAYPWPGNVRELQNCVERAVALTQHDAILLEDLPERLQQARPAPIGTPAASSGEIVPLEELERGHVLRALELLGGNKTLAAKALGLDRKTLYRKLERWQVDG